MRRRVSYGLSSTQARKDKKGWIAVFSKDGGSEKRTHRTIKKVSREMNYEQACHVRDKLNSEEKIKQEAQKRNRIEERLHKQHLTRSAYLPANVVSEFEQKIIPEKSLGMPHWRKAIEVISEINLEPSDWYERVTVVYAELERRSLSPDYARRILRIMKEFVNLMDAVGYEFVAISSWMGQLKSAWDFAIKGKEVPWISPLQ